MSTLLDENTTATPSKGLREGAFGLGERVDDPLAMYLSDIFTTPANLTGLPAVTVPAGISEGMPVGLQIIGPAFEEARILNVAYAVENMKPLAGHHPVLKP